MGLPGSPPVRGENQRRTDEQRIVIERLAVDLQRFRQPVDLLIRRMFGGVSNRA